MRKIVLGLLGLLPNGVESRLRASVSYYRSARRYPAHSVKPHGLGKSLVVSLTSYPPRFGTLDLTIKSLLRQNTKSDEVVLYVADADMAKLPAAVMKLRSEGLDIRSVPDVRSYKKLVFALTDFPDSYIVTADDDVFYRPEWLGELAQGQIETPGTIICHRVHRVSLNPDGSIAPYSNWEHDVQDNEARRPSADLMPTGLGGILYPPNSLHPDVTNQELFQRFAPSADDLWFYWCARRAGTLYSKVGDKFPQLVWWSTKKTQLYDQNVIENDRQVTALAARFGNPLSPAYGR